MNGDNPTRIHAQEVVDYRTKGSSWIWKYTPLKRNADKKTKDEDDYASENLTISIIWSILFAAIAIGLYFLVYWNWTSLPTAVMISDIDSQQDRFISEIARNNLKELTDIGPRVGGSYQNEYLAVEFLKRKINEIKAQAHSAHRIEVEVQQAKGSFLTIAQKYPMTSVYRGLQNVAVKFTSAQLEPANFLLLNSHFDTVPESPGAGDDATMVVIMLEILRKMSQQKTGFRHGVIFLFNGFEENTLQGSHGFISGHRWFKSVRAFINLDAASIGGREIMFQADPNFPFLMKYYNEFIQRPYGNAIGEEMFQNNLVPSRTDFENFASFGNIPGMDFAHSSFGYLYHTKYDSYENADLESIQHTGDNILALTKALSESNELNDIETHREGRAIFFDFLNWFMVYYTETVGAIINSLMVIVALTIIVLSLLLICKQKDIEYSDVLFEFAMSVVIQILSLFLGVGLSMLMAIILDGVGKSMAWFSAVWLVFGLYICPFLLGLCLGPLLYIYLRKTDKLNLQLRVVVFLHAQYFIMALLLLLLTAFGIRSGFVAFISILFYSFSTIINMVISFRKFHWIYIHLLVQVIPFVYFSALAMTLYGVFVPLTGRGNSLENPEITISVFSIVIGLFLFGFLTPLTPLLRRPFLFIGLIVLFFFITIIVMVTPVGFPYRPETSPQRYYLFHMERNFYNLNGTLRKTDTKMYLHPQDRHNFDYILDRVPEMKKAEHLGDECVNELYCGIPFYLNRQYRQAHTSLWFNAGQPYFAAPVVFKFKGKQKLSPTLTRFEFSLKGTDHMGLYISPISGKILKEWSFSTTIPRTGERWNNQNVYFVNYVYGVDDSALEFFIDIENSSDTEPNFIMSVVAQYMHHADERTTEYRSFISHFPDFAHVTAYQSYLENWTY